MFHNYWRGSAATAYNETVVRILVGLYVAWKLVYLPIWRLQTYPRYFDFYDPLLLPLSFDLLPALQVIGIALAAAFVLHYRFEAVSFALGTLLAYIGLISRTLTYLGNYQSLFFAALLVFLYGVYHDGRFVTPRILRQTVRPGRSPDPSLTNAPADREASSTPLEWFLMVIALTYAGSAFDKLRHAGLSWMQGDTLGAFIIFTHVDLGYHHPIAEFLLHHPALLTLGAGTVLAMQSGFVVSVYFDVLFDWLVVGLICFHVMVAILLGPVFFDQIIFLLFFFDWQHLSETIYTS